MTSDDALQLLTVVAAVGSGLVGGVYFAFSAFVMQALRELPGAEGLRAMQAINRAAPSPLFMTALLGTAAASAVVAVAAVTRLDEPDAVYQLVGSALYLASLALTVAYHIPRNDALDRLHHDREGAVDAWRSFWSGWTAWNNVRALSAVGGAVALVWSLTR